ncbi:MAG TPA: type II toxin-antitoxin system VapC family toxin [Patescibacteria group bacterium]|nr:type II toxin-antitoxin system VapC family toxin [Patescibacteria group bacterium]
MAKFVVDSSVILDWIVFGDDDKMLVHKLIEQLISKEIELVAPGFLIVEIINVLKWKYSYSQKKIEFVIRHLEQIGIVFVELGREDWSGLLEAEYKHNLTSYDAHYALMAENGGLKVITRDKDLLKSGVGIKIEDVF